MTFKLIESSNYFKTKALRDFFIVILAVSIILIGRQKNGIAYYLGLPDEYIRYIEMAFIVSGALVLIFYAYSRFSKRKGRLEISTKAITIIRNSDVVTFEISELKSLQILHKSYVGEDYERSILNNFKGDNWIELSTETDNEKFEFEVDSIYKSNQLKKLAERLKDVFPNLQYIQS